MATAEHLELIKRGVADWNGWRKDKPEVRPDLREADLSWTDLEEIDLRGADLRGAKLIGSQLRNSVISRATNMKPGYFVDADLTGADLSDAILSGADLSFSILQNASMHRVALLDMSLVLADLAGADLTDAFLGGTSFGNNDLSTVKGLDAIWRTRGPSYIDVHTLHLSRGRIPESFLRAVGVPEYIIAFMNSIAYQDEPYFSCFVSYSSKDHEFAEHLTWDLRRRGVQCWFAPEDMRIGDKIRQSIDDAIRKQEKLLLILSKPSVESEWVEKEVETAFEAERRRKTTILVPIRLDQEIMECEQAWAADIRRTRNIGDFTHWQDSASYIKAINRLIQALKKEGTEGRTT